MKCLGLGRSLKSRVFWGVVFGILVFVRFGVGIEIFVIDHINILDIKLVVMY